MMRKFLCALLTLGMAFGMTFAAAACGNKGGDNGKGSETSGSDVTQSSDGVSSESAESEEIDEGGDGGEEFIPDFSSTTDVIEYFSGRTGEVTYNTGKDLVIESLDEDAPIYLGAYSEDNVFTIDGGADFSRVFTVQGGGGGVIEANGGVLIFRNLTIENNTYGFESNYYRPYYAEFGGKVRFENCKIYCPIQLRNDATAEFINCEIKSSNADEYGVWVADGSAKFDNCKFTGYRGLKVHEISGMDVVNVTVENSFFEYLSKKPAIAIDIAEETSTTTIAFKNCDIYDCAPWTKDAVEGEDGFYESDQATTSFDFTATDCYLDGMLFSFADGNITWIEE